MSRYIDPDKIRLISDFATDGDLDILVPLTDVIRAVQMTPSEDVAPRAEVAREIFEEIEDISSDFPIYGNINTVILSERDLAFIKKKYTEEVK